MGGGRSRPPPPPLKTPPPFPLSEWAKLFSRLSANQKFSLVPLVPLSFGQIFFSLALCPPSFQDQWGGGGAPRDLL